MIVSSDGHRHSYREGIRFDKINDESRYCFLQYYIFSVIFHVHRFLTCFMIHANLNSFEKLHISFVFIHRKKLKF